jgi:DNA-3-methyladenine glycosylase I
MTTINIQRCAWAQSNTLMQNYHDNEWGKPQYDGRMLWEMLMLEGFQAGLSWITVLRKREQFRKAFAGFDPIMRDEGIIRARAKIEATISGAKIYCGMMAQGDSFSDFCWSFTQNKVLKGDGQHLPVFTPLSVEISKELKRRGFKFVGPTIVYAWMQAVGIINDHSTNCFCR